MGLKGFTSFIDYHNDYLLKEIQFHDSKLVIDGSNLMYFLYRRFRIASKFGGDYHDFRSSINTFFDALKECNIIPIVIMDGCQNSDESKLNTSIKRHDQKLKICCANVHCGKKNPYQEAIPLLLKQEFRESLKKNNIINISNHFEADDEIVKMANYFECPVLSNDSDFFVYGLKNGFLVLDYLNMNVLKKKKSYKYLTACIYHSDNLKKYFPNLDSRLIALGGTMHDNDYISFNEFQLIFKFFKISNDSNLPFDKSKFSKTIRIFSWLNSIGDYGEAMKRLLERYTGNKKVIQDKLSKCINRYTETNLDIDFVLNHDLSNYCDPTPVYSYSGKIVPGKF